MRWLCLHGRGTSAQIFELQTARIRQALGSEHEFVFVNGTVPTEPDQGAADIADEFFGYVDDGADPDQYRALRDGLADVVASQGPFHGLMGFSEGGTVAAMLLVEDARHGSFGGFQCAVFFSAAPPVDPDAVETGVVRRLDPAVDGVVLTVPTVHMWSTTCTPDEARVHQTLAQLCDASVRQIFLHGRGHDVPGAKSDEEEFQGSVRAIERAIEIARP